MYDRILVPTDGSAGAEAAARHAVGLARRLDAAIDALYVVDLPDFPRTIYLAAGEEELQEEYQTYGDEVTGDVREMAAEAGVECTTAVKNGTPHQRIAEYADEEGIDVIVMGTNGQGAIDALIGGTAEKVIRSSDVPVITVRPD